MRSNNLTENSAPKQRGKPFQKGVSGNPSGKPRGALNSSTKAAMALLDGEAEAITRKAVELALSGDIQAIRLVMDKIIPARKELPVTITIPTINNASDVMEANRQIIDSVTNGELTPSEGQSLMVMTENMRKAIDTREFEERMDLLENKLGQE